MPVQAFKEAVVTSHHYRVGRNLVSIGVRRNADGQTFPVSLEIDRGRGAKYRLALSRGKWREDSQSFGRDPMKYAKMDLKTVSGLIGKEPDGAHLREVLEHAMDRFDRGVYHADVSSEEEHLTKIFLPKALLHVGHDPKTDAAFIRLHDYSQKPILSIISPPKTQARNWSKVKINLEQADAKGHASAINALEQAIEYLEPRMDENFTMKRERMISGIKASIRELKKDENTPRTNGKKMQLLADEHEAQARTFRRREDY